MSTHVICVTTLVSGREWVCERESDISVTHNLRPDDRRWGQTVKVMEGPEAMSIISSWLWLTLIRTAQQRGTAGSLLSHLLKKALNWIQVIIETLPIVIFLFILRRTQSLLHLLLMLSALILIHSLTHTRTHTQRKSEPVLTASHTHKPTVWSL